MRKLVFMSAAALLGLSSVALADAPTGVPSPNPNSNSQGNCEGVGASALTQNGQVIGGNHGSLVDQTTGPNTRADALQAYKATFCPPS